MLLWYAFVGDDDYVYDHDYDEHYHTNTSKRCKCIINDEIVLIVLIRLLFFIFVDATLKNEKSELSWTGNTFGKNHLPIRIEGVGALFLSFVRCDRVSGQLRFDLPTKSCSEQDGSRADRYKWSYGPPINGVISPLYPLVN